MALYRTVSDRGLWKKNQRNQDPAPQHFHKPQYIDKTVPVVTYSRLSLGEGYRYNSRQSIADVRKDIEEANNRFDAVYSQQGYGRNFKSCPVTPRANTPTRTLSRSNRLLLDNESDIGTNIYINTDNSRQSNSRCSYINNPSPCNNNGSFYGHDDDRYSFESRSLTAYSNYSERDSIIDNNYRYPYAREPTYNNIYPEPTRNIEKENPFLRNSSYDAADNVVNLFLQKSFFSSVANNNNVSSSGPANSTNSTVSPVSDQTPVSSPAFNTRSAIAQLKKEFLARPPPERLPLRQKPKNKYLVRGVSSPPVSPDLELAPPPATPSDTVTCLPPTPTQTGPGQITKTGMEPFFLSDTVNTEDRPKLHHAEVINVRKDTTSTAEGGSTTSSEDEEEGFDRSRNIMVSINPPTTVNYEESAVKLEAPPQRQNIWGPSPRHVSHVSALQTSQDIAPVTFPVTEMGEPIFTHSASTFYPKYNANELTEEQTVTDSVSPTLYSEHHKQTIRQVSFPDQIDDHQNEEINFDIKEESENEPILQERSFQDPAFSNFVENQKGLDKNSGKQKKKGGFLSSLFKKPNKSKSYGDDFIHIERKVETLETSESELDSRLTEMMDQSPRFHILGDSDNGGEMVVVPMPGSPAARQLFPSGAREHSPAPASDRQEPEALPANFSPSNGADDRNQWSINTSQPLPQTKPTNLDELFNYQHESPAASLEVSHEPVRFIPEHERTQEIDIDALLALPDTPEETEEEVEAENAEFSFASSNQETTYQKNLAEEEALLEQEQQYLVTQNLALQQQLMDKETERLTELDINDRTGNGTDKMENGESEPGLSEARAESQSMTVRAEVREETSVVEKKKPKSIFNFESFRKSKPKNLPSSKKNSASPPKVETKPLEKEIKIVPDDEKIEEDGERDLATQIVREIQKSTTELNLSKTPESKPSFFNSNNLRKSVRKMKKDPPKENEVLPQVPSEKSSGEDSDVKVQDESQSNIEEVPFERARRDKKPSLFSLRSSSRERKQEKKDKERGRPISAVVKMADPQDEAEVPEKEEPVVKQSNGFGNIFGSNKNRPRQKSQDRQKKGMSLPSTMDEIQANVGDPSPAEPSPPRPEVKTEAKPKSRGFGSLFGSSKQKQSLKPSERNSQHVTESADSPTSPITPNSRVERPKERPPLPPAKAGLSDYFSSPVQPESYPREDSQVPPLDLSPITSLSPPALAPHTSPAPAAPLESHPASAAPPMSQSVSASPPEEYICSVYPPGAEQRPVSRHDLSTSLYPSHMEEPPRQSLHIPSAGQPMASHNSSFSEEQQGGPVKLRQTGRQSGRFRKSSTTPNLADRRQNSSFSHTQTDTAQSPQSAQSAFMNSLIVESISRPTTPAPHNTETKKKVSSISRTDSYRRARGTEEERPRVNRKNDTFNSLPRSQARGLRRGNSEESLRNAIDNEQSLPRSKSRQEKKGECSVM